MLAADLHAPVPGGVLVRGDRMAEPFVFVGIDVQLGTHRVRVVLALRAGIDEAAFLDGEGAAFAVTLDDIGAQVGAQVFEEPSHAGDERIVAS